MTKRDQISPELSNLYQLLKELEETKSLAVAKKLIASGIDPLQIVGCCQSAMRDVGKSYETGRFFLSGLMMAGEILRQIMELVFPLLEKQIRTDYEAKVLIGTVQGDIHDIGKNLVAMLFRCNGFQVLDLGVDVPPKEFILQAQIFKPDIIAISALLTTAHVAIGETIQLLRSSTTNIPKAFKTIIGGGFMDEIVCRNVGSDYWAKDAMDGIRQCQKMIRDNVLVLTDDRSNN